MYIGAASCLVVRKLKPWAANENHLIFILMFFESRQQWGMAWHLNRSSPSQFKNLPESMPCTFLSHYMAQSNFSCGHSNIWVRCVHRWEHVRCSSCRVRKIFWAHCPYFSLIWTDRQRCGHHIVFTNKDTLINQYDL